MRLNSVVTDFEALNDRLASIQRVRHHEDDVAMLWSDHLLYEGDFKVLLEKLLSLRVLICLFLNDLLKLLHIEGSKISLRLPIFFLFNLLELGPLTYQA